MEFLDNCELEDIMKMDMDEDAQASFLEKFK